MFNILRNPTVIATFISLGFHGLLGLNTPVLVGSFSSNKDDGKNGVGVVNLSTVEQNRIPGLGPNSDTLSTIPRLTLPSNKPVKILPLLPAIPPLKSLQTPSISPNLNLNPSQPNIISSQNKPVIKIPSNPNIPPINVDQTKTLDPKLEPLPNVTLPDLSRINVRKNRGEQPQQLADTKSASKPDRKSSPSEKNPPKNDFLSRNSNLKDPSEIGDTNDFNDVKPKGKTPPSKNIPPNIKPQNNKNDQLAFNNNTRNPNQDPRLFDDGPSFSQPEESNQNKPEKNNQESDIIKEDNLTNQSSETEPKPAKKPAKKGKNDFQEEPPKPEINITKDDTNTEIDKTQNSNNSETTKPKKPDKTVNTINKKKPTNKQKIARNTPNNNRGIPTFGNQTPQFDPSKTQPTQPYTVANNGVDITPVKKPEFPERLIEDNNTNRHNFAYNQTGTTEREGYKKYEDWANKYNPNYNTIEKHSFTSSNYPKDACLKQLNRNVAIALLVDKNGKVQDETAEIMISSGYKILNDQAIKDVKKIKLENKTEQPKPYYVEIKYEYREKICPKLTINKNKINQEEKQSDQNNDSPPSNEKKVSENADETTSVKPRANEDKKIERPHEPNTQHSEQNLERKP